MKQTLSILFSVIFLLGFSQSYGVVGVNPSIDKKEAIENEVKNSKEAWKNLSKKERKAKRKEIKSILKKAKSNKGASSDETVLLAIIAIFIPPLAMGLYDGISNRFWISLLLTILFFIPGLIYTLVVILGKK